MAWTSLNTLGTNQSKASATSLAITTSAAAEANNVVILVMAADNTSTVDGDNSESSTPTDSAGGNTWVKAGEETNGQGAAAAGATVSVWFSKLTNQIANGGTITANWGTARTAKAIMAWEFSIGAGSTVSVSGTVQREAPDAADAGALTISGLTSQEYLFVRAIAAEFSSAAEMTATANYTLMQPSSSTSGGASATNMNNSAEFRILTGTGDTSNPTLNSTTADNASIYFALLEAAADTLFAQAIM